LDSYIVENTLTADEELYGQTLIKITKRLSIVNFTEQNRCGQYRIAVSGELSEK